MFIFNKFMKYRTIFVCDIAVLGHFFAVMANVVLSNCRLTRNIDKLCYNYL